MSICASLVLAKLLSGSPNVTMSLDTKDAVTLRYVSESQGLIITEKGTPSVKRSTLLKSDPSKTINDLTNPSRIQVVKPLLSMLATHAANSKGESANVTGWNKGVATSEMDQEQRIALRSFFSGYIAQENLDENSASTSLAFQPQLLISTPTGKTFAVIVDGDRKPFSLNSSKFDVHVPDRVPPDLARKTEPLPWSEDISQASYKDLVKTLQEKYKLSVKSDVRLEPLKLIISKGGRVTLLQLLGSMAEVSNTYWRKIGDDYFLSASPTEPIAFQNLLATKDVMDSCKVICKQLAQLGLIGQEEMTLFNPAGSKNVGDLTSSESSAFQSIIRKGRVVGDASGWNELLKSNQLQNCAIGVTFAMTINHKSSGATTGLSFVFP